MAKNVNDTSSDSNNASDNIAGHRLNLCVRPYHHPQDYAAVVAVCAPGSVAGLGTREEKWPLPHLKTDTSHRPPLSTVDEVWPATSPQFAATPQHNIPLVLSLTSESTTRPQPGHDDNNGKVVAFVNVRLLTPHSHQHPTSRNVTSAYIDSLHVAPDHRRKGFATYLINTAISQHIPVHRPMVNTLHIFATSLVAPAPAARLFQSLSFSPSTLAHLWPATALIRPLLPTPPSNPSKRFDHAPPSSPASMLAALYLYEKLPHDAVRITLPHWKRLPPTQATATLITQTLRDAPFVACRYAVDSVTRMANTFLHSPHAVAERRAVWLLPAEKRLDINCNDGHDGHRKPQSLLLFLREVVADITKPAMVADVTAIVGDARGAELVVAFVDAMPAVGLFQVAFDVAISRNVIESSPLLRAGGSSPFLIHERDIVTDGVG